MGKSAVIVVDLQNDYLPTGKWPLVGIDQAVANAARVIAGARAKGQPVIHVRHEFPAEGPFFVTGTEGARIIPAVAPQGDEPVVTKHHPNAFRDTELRSMLEAEGITAVTIVGAMSHMCIDATARAAADFGYDTTTVADACATRDVEFDGRTVPAGDVHAAFMSGLAFAYGQVRTVADIAD